MSRWLSGMSYELFCNLIIENRQSKIVNRKSLGFAANLRVIMAIALIEMRAACLLAKPLQIAIFAA